MDYGALKNEPSEHFEDKIDSSGDLNNEEKKLKSSSQKESLRRNQQALGKAKSAGFAISSTTTVSSRDLALSNASISSESSDSSSSSTISSSSSRGSSYSSLNENNNSPSSSLLGNRQSSKFNSSKQSLVGRAGALADSTDSSANLAKESIEQYALESLKKYKESFLQRMMLFNGQMSDQIVGGTTLNQGLNKETESIKTNGPHTNAGGGGSNGVQNDSKKQPVRLSFSLNSLLEDKKSDNLSISSSVDEETSSTFGKLSKPKKRRLINENTEEKKLQIRNSNKEAARRCRDRRRKLIDTLQKDNKQLKETLSQVVLAVKEHQAQTGCSTLRLNVENINSLVSSKSSSGTSSKKNAQLLESAEYSRSSGGDRVKKESTTGSGESGGGEKSLSAVAKSESLGSIYSTDVSSLASRFLPNTLNHSIWSLPETMATAVADNSPFSRLPPGGGSVGLGTSLAAAPLPQASALFNISPWPSQPHQQQQQQQQLPPSDYFGTYFPNPATMASPANMYPFGEQTNVLVQQMARKMLREMCYGYITP